MAKITVLGGEEFSLRLSHLAAGMSAAIQKKAIYEGVAIVAEEIKAEMQKQFKTTTEGGLIDSLGIAPMQESGDGWDTKIGFDGYDKEGVPNPMKARVLESGSSNRKKHPFIRPAVNRSREKAQKRMEEVMTQEIEKIMNQ